MTLGFRNNNFYFNTSLLLPFNGLNGDTSGIGFTDFSELSANTIANTGNISTNSGKGANATTIVLSGAITISNASQNFGQNAVIFPLWNITNLVATSFLVVNNSNPVLSYGNGDGPWAPGTNAFTVGCWVNMTQPGVSSSATRCSAGLMTTVVEGVSVGWLIEYVVTNAGGVAGVSRSNLTSVRFVFPTGAGTETDAIGNTGGNIAMNTWNHVAAERFGDTIYVYFNGNVVNTLALTAGQLMYNNNSNVKIGRYTVGSINLNAGTDAPLVGYMQEAFFVRAPLYQGTNFAPTQANTFLSTSFNGTNTNSQLGYPNIIFNNVTFGATSNAWKGTSNSNVKITLSGNTMGILQSAIIKTVGGGGINSGGYLTTSTANQRYYVQGNVNYNGLPLPNVNVFVTRDDSYLTLGTGITNANGFYQIYWVGFGSVQNNNVSVHAFGSPGNNTLVEAHVTPIQG